MTSAKIVDETAANWIAKEDGENWSNEDARALYVWLDQDTRHRVAYLRLQAAWDRADQLNEARSGAPARAEPVAEREPPWWRIPVAASAAFLVALGTSLTFWIASERGLHETAVGATESLNLADGSRVSLNTGTRIRERLNARERRIELQEGEAYFEVAKDRSRPFVVVAGDRRIVALGTAFSVRRDASERLLISVREGVVRVLDKAGMPLAQDLSAGMVLNATANRSEVQRSGIDSVNAALEWRHGYLVFDNRPLGQVAEEFNRYTTTKIRVTAAAASKPISGIFRTDNAAGFLRLVANYPGLSATSSGDEVCIDIEDEEK